MPGWGIALICVAIVIMAILVANVIKVIMKKVAKSHGNTLDCKKYEYLFATISLVLAAIGVYCFLRFYIKVTDVNTLVKTTALYAGTVQTLYLFVVQLITKGFNGAFSAIISIFVKLKASKNPVEELPQIIDDSVSTENSEVISTETQTESKTEDKISAISDEFIKLIKGNKE